MLVHGFVARLLQILGEFCPQLLRGAFSVFLLLAFRVRFDLLELERKRRNGCGDRRRAGRGFLVRGSFCLLHGFT